MRRRPLGRTGLEVSELALGTWGLSGDGYGPVPEAEQDAVLERARAVGIGLFETADSYARGGMERRLGRLLGPDPRTRFVTKIGTDRESVPPRKRFDARFLEQSFERSRERLARERIDVVLLHNPSAAAIVSGEATGLLEGLRARGSILAWGVSAGSAQVARQAVASGAQVLEVPCNALHMEVFDAVREQCVDQGVGILARSVLSHGLLTGHVDWSREFPEGDHRAERWTPQQLRSRIRQLDALRPVVGETIPTMRAVALRYVLAQEPISSVVLGPRDQVQLDQLVREAGREPPYLSSNQLRALEGRLQEVGAR